MLPGQGLCGQVSVAELCASVPSEAKVIHTQMT